MMIAKTFTSAILCLCIFSISVYTLEFSFSVTEHHPLFRIEAETGIQELENPHAFERFAVNLEEGLEETYRNLFLLHRCFSAIASDPNKKHLDKLAPLLKFIHCQLEKSHKKYPESAPIAAMFSWYSYRYPAVSGKLPHNISLGIIIPYLQEMDSIPAIPRMMFSIFDTVARNFRDRHYEEYSRIFELTDVDPEPKEILEFLAIYWASKIDPFYSVRWTEEMVAEKQAELSEQDRRRAIRAWRQLVEAHYEVSRPIIKAEIIREQHESQRKLREKRQKEYEAMREEAKEQRRQARLDRLSELEKEVKTVEELIFIMSDLSKTGYELEGERLPNYEAIKANLGEPEAEVVNVFFYYYVYHDYTKAAIAAEKLLKQHPQDIRLLSLIAIHETRVAADQ